MLSISGTSPSAQETNNCHKPLWLMPLSPSASYFSALLWLQLEKVFRFEGLVWFDWAHWYNSGHCPISGSVTLIAWEGNMFQVLEIRMWTPWGALFHLSHYQGHIFSKWQKSVGTRLYLALRLQRFLSPPCLSNVFNVLEHIINGNTEEEKCVKQSRYVFSK